MASVEHMQLHEGDWLDVVDSDGIWNVARVLSVPSHDTIRVGYDGWGSQYDETLHVKRDADRLAPYGAYTRLVKCWAKLGAWPWWPALVTLRPPANSQGADNLQHEPRLHVDFLDSENFDERCRCWVEKKDVMAFSSTREERQQRSQKKTRKTKHSRATPTQKTFELSEELLLRSEADETLPKFLMGTLPERFNRQMLPTTKEVRDRMGDEDWLECIRQNRTKHAAAHAYVYHAPKKHKVEKPRKNLVAVTKHSPSSRSKSPKSSASKSRGEENIPRTEKPRKNLIAVTQHSSPSHSKSPKSSASKSRGEENTSPSHRNHQKRAVDSSQPDPPKRQSQRLKVNEAAATTSSRYPIAEAQRIPVASKDVSKTSKVSRKTRSSSAAREFANPPADAPQETTKSSALDSQKRSKAAAVTHSPKQQSEHPILNKESCPAPSTSTNSAATIIVVDGNEKTKTTEKAPAATKGQANDTAGPANLSVKTNSAPMKAPPPAKKQATDTTGHADTSAKTNTVPVNNASKPVRENDKSTAPSAPTVQKCKDAPRSHSSSIADPAGDSSSGQDSSSVDGSEVKPPSTSPAVIEKHVRELESSSPQSPRKIRPAVPTKRRPAELKSAVNGNVTDSAVSAKTIEHCVARKYGKTPKILKRHRKASNHLPLFVPRHQEGASELQAKNVDSTDRHQPRQREDITHIPLRVSDTQDTPPTASREAQAGSSKGEALAGPPKEAANSASGTGIHVGTSSSHDVQTPGKPNAAASDVERDSPVEVLRLLTESILHGGVKLQTREKALIDKLAEFTEKAELRDELRKKIEATTSACERDATSEEEDTRVPAHANRTELSGMKRRRSQNVEIRGNHGKKSKTSMASREVQDAAARSRLYPRLSFPSLGENWSRAVDWNMKSLYPPARNSRQVFLAQVPQPSSLSFGGPQTASSWRNADFANVVGSRSSDYRSFTFSFSDNFSMSRWYDDIHPRHS